MFNFILIIYLTLFSLIGADSCIESELTDIPLLRNYLEPDQFGGFHVTANIFYSWLNKELFVDDYFNLAESMGKITVSSRNSMFPFNLDTIQSYYYFKSNETFIISNNKCSSGPLTNENAHRITNSWTERASPLFSSKLSFSPVLLGPGIILKWLYLTNETDLPFTADFSISSCQKPNKTPMFIQFQTYSKDESINIFYGKTSFKENFQDKDPLAAHPYGFGCSRPLNDNQEIPELPNESALSFAFRMEANIFGNNIDSIDIVKHNGIYSYDVSGNGQNHPLRIIHDPNLLVDYIIDRSTGSCYFTESTLVQGSYLRWPYFNGSSSYPYNFLSVLLDKMERKDLNYFETQISESITHKIYEKTVKNFWLKNGTYINGRDSAVVTYFIPVGNIGDVKIRIFQQSDSSETKPEEIVVRLQKGYNISFNDPSRFDLRKCFNEQPIWFQIMFPVVQEYILSSQSRQLLFENEFRKKLDFIPINRLPEIRVGHYGPSVYITGALLEGADLKYKFIETKSYTISNPTSITIEDHDKDCAFSCSNDLNCISFAYCQDKRCNLFTQSNTLLQSPTMVSDKNCTLYIHRDVMNTNENEVTQAQLNQVTSSTKLLHQINSMIQQRQMILNIANQQIEGTNLFIVSHPDQIGSYTDQFQDVSNSNAQLNEYKLVLGSRKLQSDDKFFGLTYIDCLTYCQNDDNCLTVSYCDFSNECAIGSSTVEEILSNQKTITEYNDRCDILSKSYIEFFNLLPGRRLGKAPLHEIINAKPEDCAKACVNEKSFDCDSFDLCSDEQSKTYCFLYNFHAEESDQTWINGKESCNHYTRKLSKDYKQLIGMQFSDSNSVITTIEENSLENCASSCNSMTNNCTSFEYCELNDLNGSRGPYSRCRLSQNQVLIQNVTKILKQTQEFCSVYGISRQTTNQASSTFGGKQENDLNMPLMILCGACSILSGTIISAFITSYYFKKN